jgi:hypothetical protein
LCAPALPPGASSPATCLLAPLPQLHPGDPVRIDAPPHPAAPAARSATRTAASVVAPPGPDDPARSRPVIYRQPARRV